MERAACSGSRPQTRPEETGGLRSSSTSWTDSLHTQLTRFLVEQWNAAEAAGQCVFTTHDTNLLDARVFGRDAIGFVEMDPHGATRVYTLAEFDREQLYALTGRIEEGYLQGRFGAVPFTGDPARLGWNGP